MTKDELIAKIGKEEYERIESAFKDGVDISNQGEYSLLSKALNKVDMFTDDIRILGAKIPKARNIMRSFDESTRFIAEVWDGKTIPNLSKAGVKLQATQYAHAVSAVPPRINTLMARIFPDSYKDDGLGINERKMRKTMETLAKDDIRGGYVATINEIEKTNKEIVELLDLYDTGNAPSGTAGRISELQQKSQDLMDSRDEIERVHDVEQYKKDVESTRGTYIEENINRWKEIVHPEIDDLYSRWGDSKSVPLENTGETYGAMINLLSKDKEKQLDDFNENNDDIQSMSVVNYRNPDVKTLKENKSDQYSREFSTDAYNILKHSFAARTIEAKKIDLYNALIEKGAAIPRKRGEDMPLIDGKPTRLWKAKIPFKDEKTGNTSIRDVSLWVRPGVFTELTQLFGTGERFKPLPIFNAVTTIQTLGVGDGVTHTKNIHGVILNAASADPALKKLIRKLPVVGSVNAINEMLLVVKELQADTPEIRAEVDELASNVGLRGHYQPSLDLFGMHGVLHTADTAARVLLSRKFDEMVKKKVALDTPENRINYINQLGEYNRKLMSRYGSILRDLGFSPFIVAGQAMNRFSRRYILGQSGVDFASNKAALEARAMHIAGLAIVPIVGALINKATTGDFNGRPGTPVGVIDFGPEFDTEDGKRRTIDFLRLNMMRRGMRLVGLNAAIEGWKNGASLKQIQEDMKNDFVPTAMHPFIGPGLGMLVQTLTGAKIDLRTGFQGVKQSREIGGFMGFAENFRAALKEQSEFVYSLGAGKAIEYGMNKYSKTFDKLNYPEGIPAPSENQPTDVEFQEWVKPFVPTARSFIKPVLGAVGYGEIVSPALKLSAQLGMKLPYSPQQDLRYALRKEILKEVKKGNLDEAGKIFVEGRKNKILVKADENTLKGKIKEPDLLVQRVKKLKTPQDAIEVYKVASPEEQNTIIGIVAGKIGRSESVSEVKDENGISDKDRLLKEVIKSTKKGQMLYDAFKNQGSIPVEKTE